MGRVGMWRVLLLAITVVLVAQSGGCDVDRLLDTSTVEMQR